LIYVYSEIKNKRKYLSEHKTGTRLIPIGIDKVVDRVGRES